MNKPDILVFMSDQHTASLCGFQKNCIVRTPNLDSLAREGVVFDHAYTSCPLCVPARASFMTGCLPSRLHVFGNDDSYASHELTFAHSLANNGYDTVLCGRMHFMGMDQRHGFTSRIANDITSPLVGCSALYREDFAQFNRTFAQKYCTEIVGCGNSPVLEYDRYVLGKLEEYLRAPKEKPQMIVCGTYAPHFPYVADREKVRYYKALLQDMPDEHVSDYPESAFSYKRQSITREHLINLRAVYYAMIETMDKQVGRAMRAFASYLKSTGREGVFLYLSDHGDQIGRKQYFGKQTFYDYSAKIPLVISGSGIPQGKRVASPVSLMDIGPTLCGLTGSEPLPDADGVDLREIIKGEQPAERTVLSEFYDCDKDGIPLSGYMVRDKHYKLITYSGYEQEDILLDMRDDPMETVNLAPDHPDVTAKLKTAVPSDEYRKENTAAYCRHLKANGILDTWGKNNQWADLDVWHAPPCSYMEEQ